MKKNNGHQPPTGEGSPGWGDPAFSQRGQDPDRFSSGLSPDQLLRVGVGKGRGRAPPGPADPLPAGADPRAVFAICPNISLPTQKTILPPKAIIQSSKNLNRWTDLRHYEFFSSTALMYSRIHKTTEKTEKEYSPPRTSYILLTESLCPPPQRRTAVSSTIFRNLLRKNAALLAQPGGSTSRLRGGCQWAIGKMMRSRPLFKPLRFIGKGRVVLIPFFYPGATPPPPEGRVGSVPANCPPARLIPPPCPPFGKPLHL